MTVAKAKLRKKKVDSKKELPPVEAEVSQVSPEPEKEETPLTPVVLETSTVFTVEVEIWIAASTPTKDFAECVLGLFEQYSNQTLSIIVKGMGAGATHQLTKSIIEANKTMIARGKIVNRFDYWTSHSEPDRDEKSVSTTRLMLLDILPNSIAQLMIGQKPQHVQIQQVQASSRKKV